jgi:formylglycine-generating enzyme required for sulfatase activity
LTDCGQAGESCCTSPEVTGGTYFRTYDPPPTYALAPDGGPGGQADPATVSSFRLDKYEVTVGRFRRFVNALFPPDAGAGWSPAAGSGKHTHLNGGQGLANVGDDSGVEHETGWIASDDGNVVPTSANLACYPHYATWTASAGGQENLPINCVNWYEAYAFCIWDGGFLPTEAEWEYAAAGGSQQRQYPWGSTDPGTGSDYTIHGDEAGNCSYPSVGKCTGAANIAPVGTAALGAGLWGQLDLAGNVWEWNLDWNRDGIAPYVDPCVDCARQILESAVYFGSLRMARGSNFENSGHDLLSSASRLASPQTERQIGIGFRCARIP